jgi:hypothetical protein
VSIKPLTITEIRTPLWFEKFDWCAAPSLQRVTERERERERERKRADGGEGG